MGAMLPEIDEVFNEAIMTSVPVMIVEGVDDFPVYEFLAKKVDFDIEVYAVENIKGFSAGCDQVIAAMDMLRSIEQPELKVVDFVIGIIDKDVRDFRNDIPENESVFPLRYYSIESHMVNKSSVRYVLSVTTKLTQDLVDKDLIDAVYAKVERELMNIFPYSLEALRCAIDSSYHADFSYGCKIGRMKDSQLRERINRKNLNKKISLEILI